MDIFITTVIISTELDFAERSGYCGGPEIMGQIVFSLQSLPGLYGILKSVVQFKYFSAYVNIFIGTRRK